MEQLIAIKQGVEAAKSLLDLEIKETGLIRTDLAKLLADSFKVAHESLNDSINITN
jgi:hypothetical protein